MIASDLLYSDQFYDFYQKLSISISDFTQSYPMEVQNSSPLAVHQTTPHSTQHSPWQSNNAQEYINQPIANNTIDSGFGTSSPQQQVLHHDDGLQQQQGGEVQQHQVHQATPEGSPTSVPVTSTSIIRPSVIGPYVSSADDHKDITHMADLGQLLNNGTTEVFQGHGKVLIDLIN